MIDGFSQDSLAPFALVEHLVSAAAREQDPREALTKLLQDEMPESQWDTVWPAWATTIAVLHPESGDMLSKMPGAELIGPTSSARRIVCPGNDAPPSRFETVAIEMIDAAAHGTSQAQEVLDAARRNAGPGLEAVSAVLGMAMLGVVGWGLPQCSAVAAAAGLRDIEELDAAVGASLGWLGGGALPMIRSWAPMVAATCASAEDIATGAQDIGLHVTAWIIEDPWVQVTSLVPLAEALSAGGDGRESVRAQFYPLARAMHALNVAAGGESRLRLSLQLHATASPPGQGMLCRRASAIIAATATGNHDDAERYLRAALARHDRSELASLWRRILTPQDEGARQRVSLPDADVSDGDLTELRHDVARHLVRLDATLALRSSLES
ncbi:hypothetical protein [Amycolatopsis sp. NPDC004079]|uniref:hypothetical protein n=1 Tax=Amycolatopsis sp. NPDC004079 TaxID=3154549 RepID=UPI00339F9AB0